LHVVVTAVVSGCVVLLSIFNLTPFSVRTTAVLYKAIEEFTPKQDF
jgi:hypothetical protein